MPELYLPPIDPRWFTTVEKLRKTKHLTPTDAIVLRTLALFMGQNGECFPSHLTIANAAGVSPRSVARALVRAKSLGLVTWITSRKRQIDRRWVQDSNRYRLMMPASDCQNGKPLRYLEKERKKDCLGGGALPSARLHEHQVGGVDLLAVRRAAMEQRMMEQATRR